MTKQPRSHGSFISYSSPFKGPLGKNPGNKVVTKREK